MVVQFWKEDEILMTLHDQPCFPFSVGDEVYLSISNDNEDVWDAEELGQQFIVDDIEKSCEIRYPRTGNIQSVTRRMFMEVYVVDPL